MPHNLYISFLLLSLELHSAAIKFECTNNFAINYLLKLCLLCNCCVPINKKLSHKTRQNVLSLACRLIILLCFPFSAIMTNVFRDIPNVSG